MLVYDSSTLPLFQIREVTQLLVTSQKTLSRPIQGLLATSGVKPSNKTSLWVAYHFRAFTLDDLRSTLVHRNPLL